MGGALSAAAHAVVALVFLAAQPKTPDAAQARTMLLMLAPAPAPLVPDRQPAASSASAKPSPQPKPPQSAPAKPSRPRPRADRPDALPTADEGEDDAPTPAPSEAELAGAASAGSSSGRGGGPCDMSARVQAALRGDPLVRSSALTGAAPGQAFWVWNGDWVRSGGQDGKGLAAVREAILWEVAFAPPECRTAPVRGLVLITLDGAAGGRRLVLGAQTWRWADLLHPRREPRLEAEATGLRPAAR